MWSKYLWAIWADIKFSQSSLKGSVRMINLILLLLSELVMVIRAEEDWGLWFLASHHSQLVASLHPSYMAAELIACLVLWMIKLLWAASWDGQALLTSHLYARWISFPAAPPGNKLFALFIGQSSAFQYGKSNSHSSITIGSCFQRGCRSLHHSFILFRATVGRTYELM